MSNLKDWLWMDLGKIETWIEELQEEIHSKLRKLRKDNNEKSDEYIDLLYDIRYLQGKRDTLIEIKEWIKDNIRNTED